MREDGYYWVHYYGIWIPAELSKGLWWICGADTPIDPRSFAEIGERITRDAK